jgi:hypothetical protein
MSEVELSQQVSSYGTQGMTVFTVWVSVLAGYLVVAYLAGSHSHVTRRPDWIQLANATRLNRQVEARGILWAKVH